LLIVVVIAGANTATKASMRSTIYAAMVARSGVASDCQTFASLFSSEAVYSSPVGSQPARGPDEIFSQCQAWNSLLGPQGNGWYPQDLWSGGNMIATQLRIRAVSTNGCTIDLQGILQVGFNTSNGLINEWLHFYDSDWNGPQLYGQCGK